MDVALQLLRDDAMACQVRTG